MASTAILVLGMHRSGTSALTAALHGLGASLGGELVAANHDNPGGYFENAAAVTAHETLLAELDRGWEDLRDMPEGWLHAPAAEQARDAIRALLAEQFGEASLWALKDPRMCRLLPLWQPLLAEAGVQAKYLFVLRHPDEVAELGLEDAFSTAICLVEWPERLGSLRPEGALTLRFRLTEGGDARAVDLIGPPAWQPRLEALA